MSLRTLSMEILWISLDILQIPNEPEAPQVLSES